MKVADKVLFRIEKLEKHPLYSSIDSLEKLRFFMSHHVYCVWDFMCLLKFLQQRFCPSSSPWRPVVNSDVVRFINEIVVGEESDQLPSGQTMSHFEMYCRAMDEVGVDADSPLAFAKNVALHDFERDCNLYGVPPESRIFMRATLGFIDLAKPHLAAAAFALGRERLIPLMFEQLLKKFNISEQQAPTFFYYVKRHIEVDGDHHGPLALRMLECLCPSKEQYDEAQEAACRAIDARIALWDFLASQPNS